MRKIITALIIMLLAIALFGCDYWQHREYGGRYPDYGTAGQRSGLDSDVEGAKGEFKYKVWEPLKQGCTRH